MSKSKKWWGSASDSGGLSSRPNGAWPDITFFMKLAKSRTIPANRGCKKLIDEKLIDPINWLQQFCQLNN